jgi:hypothetical protein
MPLCWHNERRYEYEDRSISARSVLLNQKQDQSGPVPVAGGGPRNQAYGCGKGCWVFYRPPERYRVCIAEAGVQDRGHGGGGVPHRRRRPDHRPGGPGPLSDPVNWALPARWPCPRLGTGAIVRTHNGTTANLPSRTQVRVIARVRMTSMSRINCGPKTFPVLSLVILSNAIRMRRIAGWRLCLREDFIDCPAGLSLIPCGLDLPTPGSKRRGQATGQH